MPTITTFAHSPDQGKGLARDMGVRWALEEVEQAYDVRPVPFDALKQSSHLALQPFGQIPTYEEVDLMLFESGAIVLHIAERYAGQGTRLLPTDANARARAIGWLFAAFSTVEPPLVAYTTASLFERDQPGFEVRLPVLRERLTARLAALSDRLGSADWLDGEFSVGDLAMVTVLRRLYRSGLLDEHPPLKALVARAEARPAFQRAFAAQLALFAASSPQGAAPS